MEPDEARGSRTLMLRRLTAERRARHLTQADVAVAMGVRQSVVSDIESGRLDLRMSTLERYIRAVSSNRLFLEVVTRVDIDRSEIRKAVRMTDSQREAYYLASNANMIRLFADGRPRDPS